jgi:hypothetical protein
MVVDEATKIIEQPRQRELNGLATAQTKGIGAGEAGAKLVVRLAERVAAPAEETGGFALPELERVEGIGHEVTPLRSGEQRRRFDQQVAQSSRDFHVLPPSLREADILRSDAALVDQSVSSGRPSLVRSSS